MEECKRKHLSSSKSKNQQVKKRKGDVKTSVPSLAEKKEKYACETKISKSLKMPNKWPLSGPIVNCFREQEEKDTRKVSCPVCSSFVLHKFINQHLDDGCSSNVHGSETEDNGIVLTQREQQLAPVKKSFTPGLAVEDDVDAIISLDSNESVDNIIVEKENDWLISDLKFNEDETSCSNAESSSEKNILELKTESNSNEESSNTYQLQNQNSQLEFKRESCESMTDPSSVNDSYLQNFVCVMTTVLSHAEDKQLFNDSDNTVFKYFQELSNSSKTLYVRLFQRKHKWFRTSNIKYPRISENLEPCFTELIKVGFLRTELDDMIEMLNLLSASDVQELAKSMHIQAKVQSKKNLVNAMIGKTKTQCSIFSTNGDNIEKAIVRKAKSLLGSCVKLHVEPRNVFSRVLLLFTLNLLGDDDDNYGSQLSSIFLTNIGKIIYPSYQITRNAVIYQDRDDVIMYDLANQNLCQMDDAIARRNFDEAQEVYERVHIHFVEALKKLANNDPQLIHSVKLPIHLRRFTAPWLYTKMCSRGVDLLQRNKQYDKAVELLRELLAQNEFCPGHRGKWWERLALNLDQHLKKPAEALEVVQVGLADVEVKTGHRLALEQRAQKICKRKQNSNLKKYLAQMELTHLKEPHIETISGKRLEEVPMFVVSEVNSDGSNDSETLNYCGVEEMALRHYRRQGYNEGIHGEGLTFSTLFSLLMWDVLFSNVPDAFRTSFQAAPLDIYCENFYANRKNIIDERLDEIRNASVEKLTQWIETKWLEQEGKTCVGVKWDLFSGVEQILRLVRCLGSAVLGGVCEIFAKDYRHTRSGLPDLVVWNSKILKYKIVEVKGPNDKLSTKQQVWLDALIRLGVEAEVLYVKGNERAKATAERAMLNPISHV